MSQAHRLDLNSEFGSDKLRSLLGCFSLTAKAENKVLHEFSGKAQVEQNDISSD